MTGALLVSLWTLQDSVESECLPLSVQEKKKKTHNLKIVKKRIETVALSRF